MRPGRLPPPPPRCLGSAQAAAPADRDHIGWCRAKEQPLCGFPYDHNPDSHAYIPAGEGKYIKRSTGGRGKTREYLTSTFWYIQSAFWGGKSRFVLDLLRELKWRVDADRAANRYSSTVQDERCASRRKRPAAAAALTRRADLNYYIWREWKNSSKMIRILPHAYLYPYRSDGFGEWVREWNRPIITHGTKTPGKLLVGEVDIGTESTNQCIGFFLAPRAGLFGCHHGGGMQGWVAEDAGGTPIAWPPADGAQVRFRQATTQKGGSMCLDGSAEGDGRITHCSRPRHPNDIMWRYDSEHRLVNEASRLCLDAVKKPPHKRDPVQMHPCTDDTFQRWRITVIGDVKCKCPRNPNRAGQADSASTEGTQTWCK